MGPEARAEEIMIRRPMVPFALALLSVLLAAGPPTPAAEREESRLRGFVDGSAFLSLESEDSEVVEIHIGPTLLGAIAGAAKDDGDAAAILHGLRSVSAYIVGLGKDAERTAKATKLFREIEERLVREGWERLARVRQKGDRVNVFVLGGGKTVDGLVVLVFDRDEGQVVFANLAGSLDLAKLDRLHETLDVPGLDELSNEGKGDRKKDPERRHEQDAGDKP
jgi:hypothetical protein